MKSGKSTHKNTIARKYSLLKKQKLSNRHWIDPADEYGDCRDRVIPRRQDSMGQYRTRLSFLLSPPSPQFLPKKMTKLKSFRYLWQRG